MEIIYNKTKANIKIDIPTGDVITRKEIKYTYKSLIDGKPVEVADYNSETIVAQKLETIFSRGIANTRMKDFYDLFMFVKDKISNKTEIIINVVCSSRPKIKLVILIYNFPRLHFYINFSTYIVTNYGYSIIFTFLRLNSSNSHYFDIIFTKK